MGIVVLEFDTSAHSVARMRERLHPNNQAFRKFVEIPNSQILDSILGFQVICVVFQLVLDQEPRTFHLASSHHHGIHRVTDWLQNSRYTSRHQSMMNCSKSKVCTEKASKLKIPNNFVVTVLRYNRYSTIMQVICFFSNTIACPKSMAKVSFLKQCTCMVLNNLPPLRNFHSAHSIPTSVY